jgi:hypothetical protein
VARFDARHVWLADSCRSAAAWAAHRCDTSPGRARVEVGVARVQAAALLDEAVIERVVFDGPSRVLDTGEATAPLLEVPAHRSRSHPLAIR